MKFSFLGMGQESPPLQLYGKLPVAKDYLRIGCGDGSARDLREWLDRTFGTTRSSEDDLVLEEPMRFLGQGAKDPLEGCIWPSADAGELRKFPFTVFVERRSKALLADFDEGNLAEAEGVWRKLAETRETCLASSDGQKMLEEHRGREVDLGSFEKVTGAPADLDAWVGALWPEERLDGLFEIFARVDELARGGHAGPYRLPIVRDLPVRDQVIAWTVVLRTVGALPADEVPTLFFPPRTLVSSAAPGSLVISPKPLTDDQVVWLTTPGGEGALGPADFSQSREAELDGSPPEGETWLRDSLREALASHRARGT